jgi:hypothetical protein
MPLGRLEAAEGAKQGRLRGDALPLVLIRHRSGAGATLPSSSPNLGGAVVLDRLTPNRSGFLGVEAYGHRPGHDKEVISGAHRVGGAERGRS